MVFDDIDYMFLPVLNSIVTQSDPSAVVLRKITLTIKAASNKFRTLIQIYLYVLRLKLFVDV